MARLASQAALLPLRLLLMKDKLNSVDFRWFVVRTLPRQERALTDMLSSYRETAKNILEVYCPTHTVVRLQRDGNEARVPVFNGFVFVLATRQAITEFMERRYPEGVMLYDYSKKTAGRKADLLTIPEEQMRAFRDFNDNYADSMVILERPFSDYAFNPKTGEANEVVRVLDGPLKGREGYIARFRRDKRLVFRLRGLDGGNGLTVSIPDVWSFHVARLHNAEGDRLSVGTEKARAVDLLVGILQACGYGADTLPMLYGIVEKLAAKTSLVLLCRSLSTGGHEALARRFAQLTTCEAELVMNLVRCEIDAPGFVRQNWPRLVLRPFLTPTPGIEMPAGGTEATLSHDGFTEIIRKVSIAEQVYYPSKDRSDSVTTTYYAHIGIMPAHNSLVVGASPSPHWGEPERGFHWGEPEMGFTLFVNWDAFLGHYFLTAGKANERLVGGTTVGSPIVHGTPNSPAKLLDSFRNFAPTLYKVLADEASEVKAIHVLKVGHATINAMAITSADIASAKEKLLATCLAICTEISTTAHLAVWRRYLRTVWLHR